MTTRTAPPSYVISQDLMNLRYTVVCTLACNYLYLPVSPKRVIAYLGGSMGVIL